MVCHCPVLVDSADSESASDSESPGLDSPGQCAAAETDAAPGPLLGGESGHGGTETTLGRGLCAGPRPGPGRAHERQSRRRCIQLEVQVSHICRT